MNDPHAPRRLNVTIKYQGKDSPWVTVEASSPEAVKEMIVGAFGMDPEHVGDMTMNEVLVEAQSIVEGVGTAARQLGGRPLGKGNAWSQAKQSAPEAPAEGQQAEEQPQQEPEGPNPLLAQIDACTSREELKRLWASNQEAFKDEALMSAWKAKGKALPS